MTDCYIYIRFSSVKQEFTLSGAKSSSEERQFEACKAFADKNGWNVVDTIKDLGKSAWKGDHLKTGNLGKFAKRILAGEIPRDTVILAENIDRFSRQEARVTQRWIEDICDAGMQIATVSGGKTFNSKNLSQNLFSILEILFLAEGAFRYVQNLADRVKGSYDARLKEARFDNTAINGIGPAWLEKVGKRPDIKWVPIPERVRLIREIFDLTIAGMAPWGIAKIFNERGEISFGGRSWERTSIVKIIRNRAIEGDYVIGTGKTQAPTGEVLVGYYLSPEHPDPIVPLDVIDKARALLNRRRRGSGRNSGTINNLFGMKIRCGDCGGRMMTSGYQSRYLVCYDAMRGNGCTHRTTYKYRPFEAAALDQILHLALDETFFRQAEKSNHIGLEIAATQKAIRDWQAKASRAYDMWESAQSPTAKLRFHEAEAEVAKLEPKLAALHREREQAEGQAGADAHLRRVVGVREAISDPDDAIRLPARLRVSEALQSVVDWIDCRQYDRGKLIGMTLIDGQHFVQFDNEGNLTNLVEPHPDCTPEDIITAFDPPELRQRVHEYVRRRKA